MRAGRLFRALRALGADSTGTALIEFAFTLPVLLGRNYPPPCQGGRSVIHPIHESRGTRTAYKA